MPHIRCLLCIGLLLLSVGKAGLAQQPDLNGFRMPYRQVLKLTPDQFSTLYARRAGELNPSSPSSASSRASTAYYVQCLRIRTRLRASHLSPARRQQWHCLVMALDRWAKCEYQWNGLFSTDGTFWANDWADDSMVKESALAHIETLLERPATHVPNHEALLRNQFHLISMDTAHHTIGQVYDHANAKRFYVLRTQSQQATSELQQAVDILPASCDATLLACITQIYTDVKDSATPDKG
jgi:hypothetical protein